MEGGERIEDMASKTRPRWWQALLLITVSAVVTLVAAELGLRAYYWTRGVGRGDVRELLLRSQNAELQELGGGAGLYGLLRPSPIPDAVYELKPHLEGDFRGQRVETNRWGLRGPDVAKRKPAGVIRVVGLGDSHMFGWAMPEGVYYMARLEDELNAHALPGTRFEVLNFGAPGYNTVMEAAIFEHKALAFDPDFVLVHFVGNDFQSPHFLQPPRSFRPSQWVLVETFMGVFGEVEEEFDGSQLDPEEREELERESYRRYRDLGGRKQFRRALRRIGELAAERRVPALFMMLGEGSKRRVVARGVAREAGFYTLNPVEYFKDLMADMGEEVKPGRFRAVFRRGDWHPTPLGHRAYAKALRCELAYLGVPGLAPEATRDCVAQQSEPPGVPAPEPIAAKTAQETRPAASH